MKNSDQQSSFLSAMTVGEKVILGLLTTLQIASIIYFLNVFEGWVLLAPLLVTIPVSLWLGVRAAKRCAAVEPTGSNLNA